MATSLLIIEDNYELVLLYLTAFKMAGVAPDVANTGPAAARYIANKPPTDMVILDLHLKKEGNTEVTGGELYKILRKQWPRTKIAVVSADSQWCAEFQGLADEVIEKPIRDMGEFIGLIKHYLR